MMERRANSIVLWCVWVLTLRMWGGSVRSVVCGRVGRYVRESPHTAHARHPHMHIEEAHQNTAPFKVRISTFVMNTAKDDLDR